MNLTLHASKAMVRFIKQRSKIEIARLPCDDPARVGRVPIQSSPVNLAWQLHVIQTNRDYNDQVVLAMEAFSRYQILIPVTWDMGLKEVETILLDRWLEELLLLKATNPYLGNDMTGTVMGELLIKPPAIQWVTNTDLSINGHLADTDQWIASELSRKRSSILRDSDARDLGWYLNNQEKRIKHPEAGKLTIMPVTQLQLLCMTTVFC